MSAMQKVLGGAGLGLGGLGLVLLQLSGATAEAQTVPEGINGSRIKRTLTNGGLYPQPETQEGKKPIKRTMSGSMAVFENNVEATEVVLSKGGGDPM
eukprot:CAMPEP_0119299348 /NCGR_PEP_ID=MMETSP1333-20130426/1420_1 /TAXON_ID=418940 /ORGANISM="Scyphosphaera apsteinii, Strain RCC1455" /LENGTH=96 /DNA_ID=CAMNT_0007300741 /DNA_START=126 /DNA_END=416 /DNA_ORIENTATION=-